MDFMEFFKVIVLGVVEGITEWLPISSTGHMILVDEFIKINASDEFKEMFFVVIQLGAILSVIALYWRKILPFRMDGGFKLKNDALVMWLKIIISCIPAAVVGFLWDDELNEMFYNYTTVAIMLVLFGVLFLIVEDYRKGKGSKINSIAEISYQAAFLIGIWQLAAAVFPGTSRSGATIIGALLLGISRTVAAEYTFFLAIPVMFGASVLKLLKFGFDFTASEMMLLVTGTVTAFVVSIFAIKFLVGYIKNHDFKAFGWYRIVLGTMVFVYFLVAT